MIAGPRGTVPLTFFFASAIVARYDRFACSRLIPSANSCLAGFDPCVDASTGLLLIAEFGSAVVGELGDCCVFGAVPAFPCDCKDTTSCKRMVLISNKTVTLARSRAEA